MGKIIALVGCKIWHKTCYVLTFDFALRAPEGRGGRGSQVKKGFMVLRDSYLLKLQK